jgi:hypothetical protein
VNSDRRLPSSVTSKQLNYQALIERSGETLESAGFPDPTFTEPRISADRRGITFTVCMNADGVDAGKYVGGVAVSGPEGLGEARVGVTANLKVNVLVWLPLALLAVGIAGSAVYWKAKTDDTEINGNWWFKTVGALAVAFGALLTSYINDPAWGRAIAQRRARVGRHVPGRDRWAEAA